MVPVHLLCNAQRPAEESPYFFPRMRLKEPIYGFSSIVRFPTSTTFGVNLASLSFGFNVRWPCPDYTTGG